MSSEESCRKFQKELNAGAVSLVLLSLLHKQGEAMYGYEIAKHLESLAEGDLPMNEGAIYPTLRSLEKQGLLRSRTIASEAGPPRRYYQITAAGKHALSEWTSAWQYTTRFVNSVLELNDAQITATAGGKLSRTARTKPETEMRSRS